MATTLKKAVQRVTNAFTAEDDGEPITYHVDHQALTHFDISMRPILESGTALLNTVKRVTGFDIESMTDLAFVENNAEGFYKHEYYTANEKELAQLTKLKLDFDSMIPLPENFDDVKRARDRFKGQIDRQRREYFTIHNGELILTEAAYNRRNRAAYCIAETKEEKARLKVAQDIIAALEALEAFVPEKYTEARKNKKWAHPLPYQVRVVRGKNGPELSPNNKWVSEGWGGTNFLGVYVHTSIERQLATKRALPDLGEQYVLFSKRMADGAVQEFLVPEKDYEKKHKNINTTLLPGLYNSQGNKWGTPLEFREGSMKTPPIGSF